MCLSSNGTTAQLAKGGWSWSWAPIASYRSRRCRGWVRPPFNWAVMGAPTYAGTCPFLGKEASIPIDSLAPIRKKSRTHQRMIGRTPSPSPIRHAVDSCTYKIVYVHIIYTTTTTCMCVGVCREGEKVMGEGKRNFTLKGYGTLLTTSTSSGCLIDRSGSHACLTSFSISISFFLSFSVVFAAVQSRRGRPGHACSKRFSTTPCCRAARREIDSGGREGKRRL